MPPLDDAADADAPRRGGRLRYDPSIIGSSGARIGGAYAGNEEFLRQLRGGAAKTYKEMADNDATVGAVLFAISMLVRACEWTVQAADDSDEADEAKAFVEEVMQDMSVSWPAAIAEACSMFAYGHAALEIVWKRRGGPAEADPERRSKHDDNRIGIRNLSLRPAASIARWKIGDDGGIDGLWQQAPGAPGGEVFIGIRKLLLFRTTEEGNNPEGRSLLRTAYRSWYFKKRVEEIEAVGIERDLAGLPVAYVPGHFFDNDQASPEDIAAFARWEQLVTRIRRDEQEGILLPSTRDQSGNLLFDLKLLSAGGARAFDTSAVIDRYNRAIATSVLADFLFLGQQSVGSFALSSDKTALFATALGAYTRSIAEVFNRHLLPRLWELNPELDPELIPTINPGDLERANLAEVSDFIVKTTQAGMQWFPDRPLENRLRGMAGLPEAPEDGPELPALGAPGQETAAGWGEFAEAAAP